MSRAAHWDRVYRTKDPTQVSWFQTEATRSLALIERVAPDRSARIIDVGAGASVLVDGLLHAGYHALTMVDIAAPALDIARARLGEAGRTLTWRPGDALTLDFDAGALDVWHDRAVFHFLGDAPDRAQYLTQVRHAMAPGGHLIVATFAENGPTRCSGLDVVRYSAQALQDELGDAFHPVTSERELHTTPSGSQQAFTYGVWRYDPPAA